MPTRRLVLAGLVATALPLGPGARGAATARPDAAARAELDALTQWLLATYPENATGLGVDIGARSGLRARLTDKSGDAVVRDGAEARRRLARIERLGRTGMSPTAALDLDVARTALALAVEGDAFGFGDVAVLQGSISYRNTPYVVAQNTGAFVETPDLLDSTHPVATGADAEAYLARLERYAGQLRDETRRIADDGARGVRLPRFLLDRTIAQLEAAAARPVDEQGIVTALARRTAAIPGDWRRRAALIAGTEVAPALAGQIAELGRQRARAAADAGCWRLPRGDEYYAWALRAGTTTTLPPARVHQLGLDELRRLHAQMDPILRAQGLTTGSVGARMTALARRPGTHFSNDARGRAELMAYLAGRVADMRTRLPRAFATPVPGRLEIRRVPPAIEAGAPDGYAGPGAIDGSRPGYYYINLRDTGIWPRYALPTLTYHEGLPGHIWQGEYSYRLPLIRALLAFNAYSEGWALYAEQLGDELGAYDGDPLGRLGYLQSIAFRACRLVVDTGLHHLRWTREYAIRWMAETNGEAPEQVRGEVDRYCVWPGQACGYKVGHSEIMRLREAARTRPGFDVRRFNDALVTSGNVPLSLLPGVVARATA